MINNSSFKEFFFSVTDVISQNSKIISLQTITIVDIFLGSLREVPLHNKKSQFL